jgi:hypothetical protein
MFAGSDTSLGLRNSNAGGSSCKGCAHLGTKVPKYGHERAEWSCEPAELRAPDAPAAAALADTFFKPVHRTEGMSCAFRERPRRLSKQRGLCPGATLRYLPRHTP